MAKNDECALCAHSPGFRCIEHRYPDWLPAGPEDFGGSDEGSHYCAQTRIEPSRSVLRDDGLKALRPNLDDPYERLTAPREQSVFELAAGSRPSAFIDSVLLDCAESRLWMHYTSPEDWYEAQRYLLAQRAPA